MVSALFLFAMLRWSYSSLTGEHVGLRVGAGLSSALGHPGMIVCSCNLMTSKDVAEAVLSLRRNDPFVVITPALVYRYLGKRPSCGNCLPLINSSMETATAVAPLVMREMDQMTAGL